jgi:hypothetical protein
VNHALKVVSVEDEHIFAGNICVAQRRDAARTETSIQFLFIDAVARGKANESGTEEPTKKDRDQDDRNVFSQSTQFGGLSAKK